MDRRGWFLIRAGLVALGVWVSIPLVLILDIPLLSDVYEWLGRGVYDPLFGQGLVGWLFLLLFPIGFALTTSGIAVRKGRSQWAWFVVGLLTGVIGFVVSLFLRRSPESKVDAGLKKCPHCGEWVDRSASQCRFCLGTLTTPDPI